MRIKPARAWSRIGLAAMSAMAALVLASCSNVQDSLGLTRKPPDEFTVITKAPLIIPPNFTLRPPRPGERALGQVSPRELARRAVIASAQRGTQSAKARDILVGGANTGTGSKGELHMLSKARAVKINPKIREVLRKENLELAENRTFLEMLLFWRTPEDKSELVDAKEEVKRLRANAALGKKVNDGKVPMIKREDRGLLSKIF
jgi:hypothetical protein